jgi:hypothetical protein
LGTWMETIICRTKSEAEELLAAYKTITRIRRYPTYEGYIEGHILHLTIKD